MRRITFGGILLVYCTLFSLPASAVDESIPCSSEPTDDSIDYGETISCNIDVVGDSDLFRLQGQVGEVILLHIADGDGSNPFPIINVDVVDPTGTTVTSTTSTKEITLSATGVYTFVVSELQGDDTTDYNIAVERVAPTPSPSAIPICFGCTESHMIDPFGDMDAYSFVGSSSDVISIQISDGNGGNPFPVVKIDLYDPSGGLISSSESQIDETLGDTGTYSIIVYERDRDQSLSYDLTLQCLVGNCISPPASLVISPPSSSGYISTQVFDFALIVEGRPDLSVVGGSATFDGTDVSADLGGCLIPGTLLGGGGGQTFRCPGLDGSLLAPGSHTLGITLDLSDGSSISDSVTWNFKENSEP